MRYLCMGLVVFLVAGMVLAGDPVDVWDRVEHGQAENAGVKIHYASLGAGPVILFVHGFPDFWYTWREQMHALSGDYRTVAIDTRGYNRSDQPKGVEKYDIDLLTADIDAVREALGVESAIIVGHDWGGVQAWKYAMDYPERTEKLVIMNLTHPSGFAAVYASATEEQTRNTQYARNFIEMPFDDERSAEPFARVAANEGEVVLGHYTEAMRRSYSDGMLNYYRANYEKTAGGGLEVKQLRMPVLQFHGLQDTAVDKDGLRDTWNWIDGDYTLVTLPDVGHWVQRDGAEIVNSTMKAWLAAR